MSRPAPAVLTSKSESPTASRSAAASFWGRLSALQLTFGFSCLFLVLLQLYRPYFFLSDDNLVFWFPLVHGIGTRLSHGASPFFEPNLFGGYDLLRDPTAISLWNPLVIGLSALANTRFYLATVDLFASFNILLGALSFALLLEKLRVWKSLDISPGRIAFLSLSFAFCAYSINIGASWLMFLANQAALPLIFIGLLAPRQKQGVLWVGGGLIYTLLVGHLSPFLMTVFFLTVFSLLLCWVEGNFKPLARWGLGLVLAILVASPLLFPAAQGFLASPRNASFRQGITSASAVPVSTMLCAYFGGYIGVLLGSGTGLFGRDLIYGLASAAANWGVFASRKVRWTRLQIAIVALVGLVMLFVSRPGWLDAIVIQIPLYRSLRWPFRELFVLVFLSHLWIALRPVTLSRFAFLSTTGAGVALFLLSFAIVPPWSFSMLPLDRQLLMSGQASAYWKQVKPLIGEGNRMFCMVSPAGTKDHEKEIPYSLLGANNFPALFGVPSISGSTAPGFSQLKSEEDVPHGFGGTYSPEVGKRLLAKNAHLRALHLVSVRPLRIDLCSQDGCQTLPTPLTPAALSQKIIQESVTGIKP